MVKPFLHPVLHPVLHSVLRPDRYCIAWILGVFLWMATSVGMARGVVQTPDLGHGGGITLNLADADFSAVVSTVAEITGKNFVIDPRVKGKVTIISAHPLSKEAVYQVFLSVLDVHGFAAVTAGDVIKIVPNANAKQSATTLSTATNPGEGDEMVTRVVQVRNVQAVQLVPILRPLVAQEGHLAAYPQSNVIILSDRASNVQRVVEIISRVDVASHNEIEIIPLHRASASEVVRVLASLIQQDKAKESGGGGGSGSAGMTLVADDRTNTILLGGSNEDRLRLRTIISHMDTPLEDTGGNTVVIYLHYAQAKDLVSVLTGVQKGTERSKSVFGGGNGAQQNIDPTPVQTSASSSSGGGIFKDVSIGADEATNALVITAPPDKLHTLLSVVRQLDIRRAQVLVEAIIAEVSATRANELGVQWAVDGTGHGPIGVVSFPTSGGSGGGITNALSSAMAGAALGSKAAELSALNSLIGTGANLAGGRLTAGSFRFVTLLKALSSDGSTNILSTPNLLTLDNQEAEIVVGTNVPFITGSYSGASNGLGSSMSSSENLNGNTLGTSGINGAVSNPFQTIQRQDVGLTLKVKPQINEGDSVKLDIQQEVSSLTTPPQGISTADVVTSKRSLKTTVLVDDGQVVVLGGLIDDQVQENRNKVPLLGDIPLLGTLFRASSNNVRKSNLMIFLHPVILRDASVTSHVSGAKYTYMRDRQIEAMHPTSASAQDNELLLPPITQIEGRGMMMSAAGNANHTERTATPSPLPPDLVPNQASPANQALDQTLELPPPFENDETTPAQPSAESSDAHP